MCLFTSARTVAIVFARSAGSEAVYCAGVLTFDGGFMDSSSSRTKCITERLKTSRRQGLRNNRGPPLQLFQRRLIPGFEGSMLRRLCAALQAFNQHLDGCVHGERGDDGRVQHAVFEQRLGIAGKANPAIRKAEPPAPFGAGGVLIKGPARRQDEISIL